MSPTMMGTVSSPFFGPGDMGPVSAVHATSSLSTLSTLIWDKGLKRVPAWSLPKASQSVRSAAPVALAAAEGTCACIPRRIHGGAGSGPAAAWIAVPATVAMAKTPTPANAPRRPDLAAVTAAMSGDRRTAGNSRSRPMANGAPSRGTNAQPSKPTSPILHASVNARTSA